MGLFFELDKHEKPIYSYRFTLGLNKNYALNCKFVVLPCFPVNLQIAITSLFKYRKDFYTYLKKVMLFFFLFLCTLCWTQQQSFSFFVKIPNSDFIPEASHAPNGVKIGKTKTRIRKLNKLINTYKIYRVNSVLNNEKKETLKNIYLIVCNDLSLMTVLNTDYKTYYPVVLDLEGNDLKELFPLSILPNDYADNGGYIDTDQDELNYIRAPEAWQITKGSPDVIIGVSDRSFDPEHEDLKNKITHVFGKNHPNSSLHGAYVSSMAAAETNNGKGMAAIGYKSHIYLATNNSIAGVDTLSKMKEVKVISTAWTTSGNNAPAFKKAFERGKVIVAAAGNGHKKNQVTTIYPAEFKNVISVSSIGHHNHTYYRGKKPHEVIENAHVLNKGKSSEWTHHRNDSVDIVAPGYGLLLAKDNNEGKSIYTAVAHGTSYAAPMVSGTIALMFDVNYCLAPKEIETILKLTAVKIDTLPMNKALYGKLGAGKLDAYRAVKMAKDMADEFGTVQVKDRILYRWFYKLETAPYNIEMINNDVTGNARLKFKARNSIRIKSGHYYPKKGGAINLSIDKNLALEDCTPRPNSLKTIHNPSQIKLDINNALFKVYPVSFDKYVTISKKEALIDNISYIIVYNVLGEIVHEEKNINTTSTKIDLAHLENGPYLAKIFNSEGVIICVKEIFRN